MKFVFTFASTPEVSFDEKSAKTVPALAEIVSYF